MKIHLIGFTSISDENKTIIGLKYCICNDSTTRLDENKTIIGLK